MCENQRFGEHGAWDYQGWVHLPLGASVHASLLRNGERRMCRQRATGWVTRSRDNREVSRNICINMSGFSPAGSGLSAHGSGVFGFGS